MPAKQIVRIILGEEKTTKKGMNKQQTETNKQKHSQSTVNNLVL